MYSYLEPVLMIKGFIKHNLTIEEFTDYLKKHISDSGKFLPLKMNNLELSNRFSKIKYDWLLEREYKFLEKRFIQKN